MDNAAFLSVVPRDLQEQARWVVWRVELRPTRNGEKKPTKVPYNARTGALASSTDPNTWSTVKTALRALERSDEYNGVGFVTGKELGITGIDLDHCRDMVTEEIEPWALAICDQMQSYTEISPSQTGLRIFIRASLPPGRRRTGSLEMYDEGRFFTVTGNALLDYPLTIEARQSELEQLHKATFAVSEHAPRKRTPSEPVRLDDQALLKKAQEAKNGQKFFHLWRGEASEYGEDLSRADLALCGMLAFWTGGDASRMDSLFRQSGLMRDKWDDQRGASTYGQRTILTALSTLGETYSPIPLQSRAKHSQKDAQQEDQPQTDGES
jgi:putative DNA primase/helicase